MYKKTPRSLANQGVSLNPLTITVTSPSGSRRITLQRRHSLPPQIQLPPTTTPQVREAVMYLFGAETEYAFAQIEAAAWKIEALIFSISDDVVRSEALGGIKDWQIQALRTFIAVRGELQPIDQQINDAVYVFQRAVERGEAFMENETATQLNHAAVQSTLARAKAFREGVYNLMNADSRYHDNGESLQAALLEHALDDTDRMKGAMRDLGFRLGRTTGPDEVTRAIGEYALDHVEEWGRQWKLIGKRHLSHLQNLERPTLIDRKVVEKYKETGGYLDRMGEWHCTDKNYLLNTVRNAYRAVGGK